MNPPTMSNIVKMKPTKRIIEGVCEKTLFIHNPPFHHQDAQKGRPARPQAIRNRRRTLRGTLRISMSREQSWRTFSASVRSSIAPGTKNGQFMESGVDKLERSVDNPEIQMEGRDVRDETQSNQWPLWIGAIALCLSVSSCKPDDSPFKAENESIRKQLAKQESVVNSLQVENKVMTNKCELLYLVYRKWRKY